MTNNSDTLVDVAMQRVVHWQAGPLHQFHSRFLQTHAHTLLITRQCNGRH